jgi:hypothetical protein
VHVVAFVDDQVTVALCPVEILAGDTDTATVGAGVGTDALIAALAVAVPPGPVHVKV